MSGRRDRALASPFVVVISGLVASCAASPEPTVALLPPVPSPATSSPPPPPAAPSNAETAPAPPADRDRDRIVDDEDRCPDEPETWNGRDDGDGCPDAHVVLIPPSNPPPPVFLHFSGHSVVLSKDQASVLDDVAAVVRDHPEIIRLRIEGHEDPSSAPDKALHLSKARALHVRDELVRRGVPTQTLRPVGLGAYCPVAIASAIEDRNKNRRVTFVIEETTTGPTEAGVCAPARAAGLL